MAEDAVKNGKVTVYSSYPIGNGVFVTPSRMEAESYSANGKVYSKTVNVDDVAWIDPTQGQYAPIGMKFSASAEQGGEAYKGINLAEDGTAYTYDFLTAQPDMNVTTLPEVDAVRGENNRVDTAKVVQQGMKNARAVGTERDGKV